MVPRAGVEPARLAARDFKSRASTNFATRAALNDRLAITSESATALRYRTYIGSGVGQEHTLQAVRLRSFRPGCGSHCKHLHRRSRLMPEVGSKFTIRLSSPDLVFSAEIDQ